MTQPSEEPAGGSASAAATGAGAVIEEGPVVLFLRMLAFSSVAIGLMFPFNAVLIFWFDWPGALNLLGQMGWFGLEPPLQPIADEAIMLGWVQVATYVLPALASVAYVLVNRQRGLHQDAVTLSALAAYIVRVAFWSVLLVGLADMAISFLRVEGFLVGVVGEDLAKDLGRSSYRGTHVHYPLIGLSLIIAYFSRSLGFAWLALLIVAAEIQIVIARFIFSYEQAFMADLVRFWYAALFLFASAYTLVHEGHVRVDILYAGFRERGKAWTNCLGSLILGIPLCWVVMTRGMWSGTNSITGPLLNYEVTQAGFGMYVKYLMAGFLLVYALSMLVQFTSQFLNSVAVLSREPGLEPAPEEQHAEI